MLNTRKINKMETIQAVNSVQIPNNAPAKVSNNINHPNLYIFLHFMEKI